MEGKIFSLLDVAKNIPARVVDIKGGRSLELRLMNLGVKKGVILKKKAVCLNGPVIIEIKRSILALGRGMSSKIEVELE
ncbi:MAG: FeoA domain-containing protein [Candidatus Omnitrophica bacterium]|nr:FeoA domain-containing protein [Candidatus Omnitrophota bacterium]